MTAPINDGGPACPVLNSSYNSVSKKWEPNGPIGMSLRDWFAANDQLGEWNSNEAVPSRNMTEALAGPMPSHGWGCKNEEEWIAILAWEAKWRARIKYIRADAMLAEREKGAK